MYVRNLYLKTYWDCIDFQLYPHKKCNIHTWFLSWQTNWLKSGLVFFLKNNFIHLADNSEIRLVIQGEVIVYTGFKCQPPLPPLSPCHGRPVWRVPALYSVMAFMSIHLNVDIISGQVKRTLTPNVNVIVNDTCPHEDHLINNMSNSLLHSTRSNMWYFAIHSGLTFPQNTSSISHVQLAK